MQTEEIFVKNGYCLMDEAISMVGARLFPEGGPDIENYGVWSGQEKPQFQSMPEPSIRRSEIDQHEAKYEERQRRSVSDDNNFDWNRLPEKMPRQ